MVARFIFGVGVGLNTMIVPMYVKEFTPIPLRGTAGTMNQIMLNVGGTMAFIIALY